MSASRNIRYRRWKNAGKNGGEIKANTTFQFCVLPFMLSRSSQPFQRLLCQICLLWGFHFKRYINIYKNVKRQIFAAFFTFVQANGLLCVFCELTICTSVVQPQKYTKKKYRVHFFTRKLCTRWCAISRLQGHRREISCLTPRLLYFCIGNGSEFIWGMYFLQFIYWKFYSHTI